MNESSSEPELDAQVDGPVGGPVGQTKDSSDQREAAEQFRYVHSANFPTLLESLGLTLLATTYQAGKLVAFRARDGRVSMLLRTFDKAMGLAVDGERMAVATNYQVWVLRNCQQLAGQLAPDRSHDACFLPRVCYITGRLDFHEIGWCSDQLYAVNTLFSCLCTVDEQYSFTPKWRPPFVTDLRREDRCHLNGLAVVDGQPRYVTAFGATDEREGWRPKKLNGGVLVEVPSGEIVVEGLCMPHSPRVYDGRVWVLNSGCGSLSLVDPQKGRLETVVELPGYTRGLAFRGRYAFVGLSKIRETAIFGGVPVAERLKERKCGVWVIDLTAGEVVAFVEFQGAVEEVFDVQLLPGVRYPAIVGLQKETIQRACVIGS